MNLLSLVLCMHVLLSSLPLQVVLETCLQMLDLIDSCSLLLLECLLANLHRVHFLGLSNPSLLQLQILLLLILLLFLDPPNHRLIILDLQVIHLLRLCLRLIDLLLCSDNLCSEHSDSVPELLHISLQLKSDGPCLVVSEIFTLNVNDHVLLLDLGRTALAH